MTMCSLRLVEPGKEVVTIMGCAHWGVYLCPMIKLDKPHGWLVPLSES